MTLLMLRTFACAEHDQYDEQKHDHADDQNGHRTVIWKSLGARQSGFYVWFEKKAVWIPNLVV